MTLLFLSDVHLGALNETESESLELEIIQIIHYCNRNNIRIHLLGDLFDYWMEYPNYTPPLGESLLNQFSKFHQKNETGLYITGNHDYWTRDHFNRSGFDVEHEYRIIEYDNKSFFLTHGDGMTDPQYQLPRPLLHRILRNNYFVNLFQALFSGPTGNHIMKSFSELTRDNNNLNTDRLSKWALNTLNKFSFDYIITGHDHVPRKETFSTGTYINTGAYYLHKSAAIYTNGDVQLVKWDSDKMTFNPFSNKSD